MKSARFFSKIIFFIFHLFKTIYDKKQKLQLFIYLFIKPNERECMMKKNMNAMCALRSTKNYENLIVQNTVDSLFVSILHSSGVYDKTYTA